MEYKKIIQKKSFENNLKYLNNEIKEALENKGVPVKIIGNLFYPHTPGLFFEQELYHPMHEKRTRYSLAMQGKKNMFEIGINGGHSSLLALESNPDLCITANDIASFYHPCPDRHPEIYVKVACRVLKELYQERFDYIIGNCLESIPKFTKENQSIFFDVIHIDGVKNTYTKDFNNLYRNMTEDCVIIFDDMQDPQVSRQVCDLMNHHKIVKHENFPRMKGSSYTHEIVSVVK
jgi:predicted O-methyltransferase YrrM